MKSKINEDSKYPMTYGEFKNKVIELFLEEADSPQDLEIRQYVLKEDGEDIIKGEYEDACYYYDDPKSPSTQFTDEGLLRQPVRILEMI